MMSKEMNQELKEECVIQSLKNQVQLLEQMECMGIFHAGCKECIKESKELIKEVRLNR